MQAMKLMRRQLMVWGAAAGVALASAEDGVSNTAESIHQEPVFNASRKRVYDALTETKQFDRIIQISGAMQTMALGDKPTEISQQLGGAFTLFG